MSIIRVICTLPFAVIHIDRMKYVSTCGGDAELTCLATSTIDFRDVFWTINESRVDRSNFPNAMIETSHFGSVLRLRNFTRNYNNSNIRCLLNSGIASRRTTLVIQG